MIPVVYCLKQLSRDTPQKAEFFVFIEGNYMNLDKFKDTLSKFIEIKSISAPGFDKEIREAANFLVDLFNSLGLKSQIIEGKTTNPYVFAEYKVSDAAETVLIYGHYDVQPADKSDGWKEEPFEIDERDGKLIARGIEDNKGQVMVHIFTVGELVKEKKLKKNVKFFIEGNEETANPEIINVIRDNKNLLNCDYVLISDGEISNENPAMDVSFRGGVNMRVILETAKNDVHSGIFGGAFPNAAMELSNLISKLYDENNRIGIDGFYRDVAEPTKEELENNAGIKFDLDKIKSDTGIKSLKMQEGLDFYTQTGLLPMLTVTGFKSGFIGEGFNNIIPAKAECRINFRFSAGQKPKEMVKLFKNFVRKNTPDYVTIVFEVDPTFNPVKIDISDPIFNEVKKDLEESYGAKLIFKYCGASIPVVADFAESLDKPVLSVGFAGEDANSHGVDENFRIDLIEKALKFSRKFLGE